MVMSEGYFLSIPNKNIRFYYITYKIDQFSLA